jgi:hypothetical protein
MTIVPAVMNGVGNHQVIPRKLEEPIIPALNFIG